MGLTIRSRVEDGFGILELAGQLTLGPMLSTLREDAHKILNTKRLSGLIIVVSEVTDSDSAGLGELMRAYELANKHGCAVRLVQVNPHLKKMLAVTHLDGVLPALDDVPTAKAAMKH